VRRTRGLRRRIEPCDRTWEDFVPQLAAFFRRIRDRLGWPLLAVIGSGLVILVALALTPGERTMAAPRPESPAGAPPASKAEAKADPKTETPAMGESSTEAPKKPSPAIPKKTRRR